MNYNAFLNSLVYMGEGMLTIFAVTGVIIGVIALIKAFSKKGDK